MTLMDISFLHYYPSEIALSCILLSFRTFSRDIPSVFLESTLHYEQSLEGNGDVLSLLKDRNSLMTQIDKLQKSVAELPQQAIYKKYCGSNYFKVAKMQIGL